MSPLAHYIISTSQPRRRSTASLSSTTTTSSMNSDIGLQATTADIGTPKGSSIDLAARWKPEGDTPSAVSQEQSCVQVRGGGGMGGQRLGLGNGNQKRKGEGRGE
ncbi:hypothetical protein PMIN01_05174 [Paraphaeosphaeria minitans]|uniref:Uncharacterized protein n=1 Tax=Paraphaeosphaeria minitans TaxID=565426 RepID=A0A9P6KSM3_9PLEO|nr:hypothetical protein PMIN01_05174 [Paraphaeosphaeria minitans]